MNCYFDLQTIYCFLESNVFEKTRLVGEVSNKLPNSLFGTNVYNILQSC